MQKTAPHFPIQSSPLPSKASPAAFPLFLLLLLLSAASPAFAFTIDSYYSEAWILPDGGLAVYEGITFTLEQESPEGYRTIRPQDYGGDLNNLILHSVKVNGNPANSYTQEYEGNAEIVWTETFKGKNVVELNYTLKNLAESYNDFAKICFEHYGAGWDARARTFRSVTHLPESTRGTEMHFEVYSKKVGRAYADDLAIVIELENVPSGNYVGACYLFNNSAVSTPNYVNASALQILQDERKSYGSLEASSDTVIPPLCCLPIALLLLAICAYLLYSYKAPPKLREGILPPSKEHPAAVSVLLRAKYDEKEILAATILGLINKGVLDIVEVEKGGSQYSQELRKERTILFLKKRPETLKKEEQIVLDMVFAEGEKEVDLDALAERWKKISSKSEAKKTIIPKKMSEFSKEIKSLIKRKKLEEYRKKENSRLGHAVALASLPLIPLLCAGLDLFFALPEILPRMVEEGQALEALLIILGILGTAVLFPLMIYLYRRPQPPEGKEEEYSKWDSFRRAVNATTLHETPPSGAIIWGEILVYATALGIAKKVEKHLSELDTLLASRIQKMERVRASTFVLYSSAMGVRNLSRYGNRSGFSRSSSGGWSSHGGGGFSGGSSGGGGFR